MKTEIPFKRLEYSGIKAEVKKFAASNNFTLEKKFSIVPVLLSFSKPFGKLEANKEYPCYVINAFLHGRTPYTLIFWLFQDTTDNIAANSLVKFTTTEITTAFSWQGLHYQKELDSLTNTFNFKKK